jgi:2-methylcitrate dehydratase PrpD
MLIEDIAGYAVAERERSLPAPVIHHTKRAVIDWFAALLPGGVIAPAVLLVAALEEELGRGGARLYPSGAPAGARTAALVNGTASHTIEFDDIFRDAIYHPGCPTIAAALAAAQARGASGADLLKAVIVGYEVSTRIGLAVVPAHYRFWHTTGTVGCFGAAAAVATVLRLDQAQTMHALATVGTFAAGLQQAFRSESMSKPLHAGRAAEAGLLAAFAAERGLTGALDILEGEAGFGAAMGGTPQWQKATAGLGRDYNITRITFKNHACCGHSFAAIDGVLALKRAHGLDAEAIERVRVATYKTALDVTGRAASATPFEAKFSLPFVVAAALVHGSVRLDAFSAERLADPRTNALMARVDLAIDPELDAAFPSRRAARVEILTKDGRRLAHDQPTRKGDPDAPFSDAELTDKFFELVTSVIGADRARALLDGLWRLDETARVDQLLPS